MTITVTNAPLSYDEQAGRFLLEQGAQYRPRQGAELFAIEGGRSWCAISGPSRADLKLIRRDDKCD